MLWAACSAAAPDIARSLPRCWEFMTVSLGKLHQRQVTLWETALFDLTVCPKLRAPRSTEQTKLRQERWRCGRFGVRFIGHGFRSAISRPTSPSMQELLRS